MLETMTERVAQTDIHAGCIHSTGGVLFGRYGPRLQGRPPLSAEHPPCLAAGLSLPDEAESEVKGVIEVRSKCQFTPQICAAYTRYHFVCKPHTGNEKYFHPLLSLKTSFLSIICIKENYV